MDTNTTPVEPSGSLTGVAADALIAEYKSLRDEIVQRINFQFLIMAGTVALLAALIPLAAKYANGHHVTVLFAAPLVFAATTWLYFEQDIFITQAASYLNNSLAPRLREHVSQDVAGSLMQWEIERHRMLFGNPTTKRLVDVMFWVRLFAVLGAGIAAMLVALVVIIEKSPDRVLRWFDYPLIVIDLAVIGGLCWLSRHVRHRYEGITGELGPSDMDSPKQLDPRGE